MKQLGLVFALFACFVSCKVSSSYSYESIKAIAENEFGKEVTIELNTTKIFALCYSKKEESHLFPGNALEYGIINLKTGTVIYKESKHHASVKWHDENTVEVHSINEVSAKERVTNEQMNSYYIDVKTLKKSNTPTK